MRSPLLAAILLTGLVTALALGLALSLRNHASIQPMDCLPRDTTLLLLAPEPPRLFGELSRASGTWGGTPDGADMLGDFFTRELQLHGIPAVASAREISRLAGGETLIATVPDGVEDRAGTVMIFDLRQPGATMPAIIHQITRQALGAQGDEAWSTRSYHEHDYETFHLQGKQGGISAAQMKGLGIVTTSGALMRRILDTADGRAGSLRSDPAYHLTRDHLGKHGSLFAYASGSWIAAAMNRHVKPGPMHHALKLLGLDAVTGAGLALEVRKQLFHERLFVALRGDRRGLTGEMFDTVARTPRTSTLIPAGFPFYLSVSFSGLDTVYRKLPEILATATGEDRKVMRDRLEGLEQFMAMDVDRELFGALGNDLWIGFGGASRYPRSASNRTLLNTPAVAAISLNNPPAITRALGRFDGLARAMGAYHRSLRGGQPVTSYEFTQIAPLSPAYRIVGGHLVAATSAALLEQAMEAGRAHSSVADQPGLSSLLEQLPDRAHLFFFADTARLADLLRVSRQSMDPFGPPLGPPEADRADRTISVDRLPASAAAARLTTAGLTVEWISPLSPSLLLSSWLLSAVEDESGTVDETAPEPGAEIPF
ncbi:MAG TPA: hypothetical protein VFE84_07130 [Patescibacteria group bacterium]|nr:hypothetical protein [Patescibacteria group bacterium]